VHIAQRDWLALEKPTCASIAIAAKLVPFNCRSGEQYRFSKWG
jgi:hypothetical protein